MSGAVVLTVIAVFFVMFPSYSFTIPPYEQRFVGILNFTDRPFRGRSSRRNFVSNSSTRKEELVKLEALGHWEGEVQYRRKDGSYVFVELPPQL